MMTARVMEEVWPADWRKTHFQSLRHLRSHFQTDSSLCEEVWGVLWEGYLLGSCARFLAAQQGGVFLHRNRHIQKDWSRRLLSLVHSMKFLRWLRRQQDHQRDSRCQDNWPRRGPFHSDREMMMNISNVNLKEKCVCFFYCLYHISKFFLFIRHWFELFLFIFNAS